MSNEAPTTLPGSKIVVYEVPDGKVQVDVHLDGKTVWLTQRQMAQVFQTLTDNVGLHLKNVFAEQVNSKRSLRFRQWATRTLRDHLVRGYTHERTSARRAWPVGCAVDEVGFGGVAGGRC